MNISTFKQTLSKALSKKVEYDCQRCGAEIILSEKANRVICPGCESEVSAEEIITHLVKDVLKGRFKE